MMKKVILGLIAAAAMTSCIKREDSLATDQNSNLGTGTIKGTILAKTNYYQDTLANGATDFNNLGTSGLEGFTVNAWYSSNDLDPDNVNGETKFMNTTTDANGEWSFDIEASGEGTAVTIVIDGIQNIDVTYGGNADDGRLCQEDLIGDTASYNPIRFTVHTESLRFIAEDLAQDTIMAVLRNGQTQTIDREVLEAEELQ